MTRLLVPALIAVLAAACGGEATPAETAGALPGAGDHATAGAETSPATPASPEAADDAAAADDGSDSRVEIRYFALSPG